MSKILTLLKAVFTLGYSLYFEYKQMKTQLHATIKGVDKMKTHIMNTAEQFKNGNVSAGNLADRLDPKSFMAALKIEHKTSGVYDSIKKIIHNLKKG